MVKVCGIMIDMQVKAKTVKACSFLAQTFWKTLCAFI